MTAEEYNKVIGLIGEAIRRNRHDPKPYADMLTMYKAEIDMEDDEFNAKPPILRGVRGGQMKVANERVVEEFRARGLIRQTENSKALHAANASLRNEIVRVCHELVEGQDYKPVERFNMLYRKSLLMDSLVDFDAYMLYVEMDREPAKRFWLPRRSILRPVAEDMATLVQGDTRMLGISLPPGTGKTTLAIFFLTWIAGKWPDEYSVVFSHDGDILKGMYGEVLRIINPNGEYLWKDVFPDVPMAGTNAKDMRIDLGHGSRFETIQFASVGSENAGKARASKLLYCDDLVGSIEQAMSRERLDKLWTQYTADIQQRGTGDYRELHIATRWSVWDVIGRLERQEQDNPTGRARFIAVPALNEKDESNFDYPGIGSKFTTERYHQLRDSMDDVNWRCLYMNQPIEREGQLYSEDELRRYFELPEDAPEAVVAVCDTKAKGNDYCVMPVAEKHGEDYYITDVVCDNGDPGVIEERLAKLLTDRKVQMCQFESNSAGWSVAENVQKRVKELGGVCSISTLPTTANKETKIVVNSPFVKQRFLFRDSGSYRRSEDYGRMVEMLTGYSTTGRNKHDDVPDAMAMLALYVQSLGGSRVRAMQRPF